MAVMWPPGVASAGMSCGIKGDGRLDLGILVAERPLRWAGTFTRNAAAAASVQWCRSKLTHDVRAVVVNSGNANACTGHGGLVAVERIANAAAGELGCSPDEVLVASTGPIGVPLPTEKIVGALPGLVASAGTDPSDFADAILTTDTHRKTSGASAGDTTAIGVAKGAAMLAPNMATMLAFIATDAAVPAGEVQRVLSDAVSATFDRICVDACESTNDSVFLLTTEEKDADAEQLAHALRRVCGDLALQMVGDAEGATRVVRIAVDGASDDATAVILGKAVAASALWRAAAYGGDPNWGRVVAALGAAHPTLDLSSVSVAIGPETVFARGEPAGSLEAAAKHMDADGFVVSCVVGSGSGSAEVLSTDLSPSYVDLNAGGLT